MTKNQIIAKAMLTTLGIYAGFAFISNFMTNLYSFPGALGHLVTLILTVAMIFVIARFLIFNNDAFACMITSDEDQTEDFNRSDYLIKAFRIGFVILGLLFLCSPNTIRFTTRLVKILSPPNIRLWATSAIQTKRITGNLDVSIHSLQHLLTVFKLAIIAYLLFGGKFIIRRHLKSISQNPNED